MSTIGELIARSKQRQAAREADTTSAIEEQYALDHAPKESRVLFGMDQILQTGKELIHAAEDKPLPFEIGKQEREEKLIRDAQLIDQRKKDLATQYGISPHEEEINVAASVPVYGIDLLGGLTATGTKLGQKGLQKLAEGSLQSQILKNAAVTGALGTTSEFAHRELREEGADSALDVDPTKVAQSFAFNAGFGSILHMAGASLKAGADTAARKVKMSKIKKKDGWFKVDAGAILKGVSQITKQDISKLDIAILVNGQKVSPNELKANRANMSDDEFEDVTISIDGEVILEAKNTSRGLMTNTDNEKAMVFINKAIGGKDIVSPLKDEDIIPTKKRETQVEGEVRERDRDDSDPYEDLGTFQAQEGNQDVLDINNAVNDAYMEALGNLDEDVKKVLGSDTKAFSKHSQAAMNKAKDDVMMAIDERLNSLLESKQIDIDEVKAAQEIIKKRLSNKSLTEMSSIIDDIQGSTTSYKMLRDEPRGQMDIQRRAAEEQAGGPQFTPKPKVDTVEPTKDTLFSQKQKVDITNRVNKGNISGLVGSIQDITNKLDLDNPIHQMTGKMANIASKIDKLTTKINNARKAKDYAKVKRLNIARRKEYSKFYKTNRELDNALRKEDGTKQIVAQPKDVQSSYDRIKNSIQDKESPMKVLDVINEELYKLGHYSDEKAPTSNIDDMGMIDDLILDGLERIQSLVSKEKAKEFRRSRQELEDSWNKYKESDAFKAGERLVEEQRAKPEKQEARVEFSKKKDVANIEAKQKEIDKIESIIDDIESGKKVSVKDLPQHLQSFIKNNNIVDDKQINRIVKKELELLNKGKSTLERNKALKEAILADTKDIKERGLDKDIDVLESPAVKEGIGFTIKGLYNTNKSKISDILGDKPNIEYVASTRSGNAEIIKDKDGKLHIKIPKDSTSSTQLHDIVHEYGHAVLDSLGIAGDKAKMKEIRDWFSESFKYVDEQLKTKSGGHKDLEGKLTFHQMFNESFVSTYYDYYLNKGYSEVAAYEEALNAMFDNFLMHQFLKDDLLVKKFGLNKKEIESQFKFDSFTNDMWTQFLDYTASSHMKRAPESLQRYMTTMIDITNHPDLGIERLMLNRKTASRVGTKKINDIIWSSKTGTRIRKSDWGIEVAKMFDESTWSTFLNTNSEFAAVQHIAGKVAGHRRNIDQSVAAYRIALEQEIDLHLGVGGDKKLGEASHLGLHWLTNEYKSWDELFEAAKDGKLYDKNDAVRLFNSIAETLHDIGLIDSKRLIKGTDIDVKGYEKINSLINAIANETTYKAINGEMHPVRTSVDAIDEIVRIFSKNEKVPFSKAKMRSIKKHLKENTDVFESINILVAKHRVGKSINADISGYKLENNQNIFDNEWFKHFSNQMRSEELGLLKDKEYNSQFGFNPGAEYQREGLRLITTSKKSDLIGKPIYSINGLHIGFTPKRSVTLGEGESILGKSKVDEAERGTDAVTIKLKSEKKKVGNKWKDVVSIRTRKGWQVLDDKGLNKLKKFGVISLDEKRKTGTIRINDNSKIYSNAMYDHSYSKMSARNKYVSEVKYSNNAIYNAGIRDAIEAGLLRQTLDGVENTNAWTEMKLDNGVKYYVKKKWLHQFKEQQGQEIKGHLGTVLRVLKGSIDIVKNLYLVGSPNGYINSAISSLYSGAILSDNPVKYSKNLKTTNNEFNEYLDLVTKKAKAEVKGDKKAVDRFKKEINSHWIHDAYEAGIQATLRNAHKALGDFEKNEALSAMRYNRFFRTPKNVVDGLESVYLRPESDIGARVGEFYDKTEIVPKLALIKTKMEEGLSKENAIEFAKMAFPDYNMKLPPELSYIGDFVPFLKFATNIPKIAMFTAQERFRRLMFTKMLGMGIVYGSYGGDVDDNWYYEHDFVKIPGFDDYYIYSGSWSNIPNLFNIGASVPEALLDPVEISSRMIVPYDINPITVGN